MRRGLRPLAIVLLGGFLLPLACAGTVRTAAPALRRLDERHAAEFRQVFEEAVDRPRYVVALSPT